MNSRIFILLTLFVLFSGCATVRSKRVYSIPINTIPEKADIRVTDRNGKLIISTQSPDTLVLKAGAGYFKRGEYLIEVSHDHYHTKKETFYFVMDRWYKENWAFLIFMPIGYLLVDPLSGAMWKPDKTELKIKLNQIIVN